MMLVKCHRSGMRIPWWHLANFGLTVGLLFFLCWLHMKINWDSMIHSELSGVTVRALNQPSWNLIALYRGNGTDPRLQRLWTSQVGQDQTIVDIFAGKREGYFVDLASNDAVSLSNTLTLEREFGWKGLCIEANPYYMKGYLHRTCQLVQAVVGPVDNETVSFKFDNGALGGVVGEAFDNKMDTASTSMHTVSVAKILRDFHAPAVIDYLSLDIEGAEAWAFKTFPWDDFVFLSLTVERPKSQLIEMLKQHGYVYLCDHGRFGDQLWVHPHLPNYEEIVFKYGNRKQCRSLP